MQYPQVQKLLNSQFVFGDIFFDFEKLLTLLTPSFIPEVKQVHGTNGLIVSNKFDFKYYKPVEVDFIITNKPGVFLPILTADCLPIFLYDPILHVIGSVHAGWRGSVAGVLDCSIKAMKNEFKTDIKDLQLIFGPSAKNCCYQVKSDCIDIMKQSDLTKILDKALVVRDSLIYFDLCAYNSMRAYNLGVLNQNINSEFSCCSMCRGNFFSYRKQKKETGRNINGIMLL